MKTRFFLLCSLLLASMVTLCQGKQATKVIVYTSTQPPSPRSRLEEVSLVFQGEVLQALTEKYPCLETISAFEAEALVGWKKSEQLLGVDDNTDFANHAAGGLGVKYAVTLTVSQLSTGQYLLGASIKPGFLPDPQAGGGNLIGSSDDAVFAGAKAEAKRFADSLSRQFKEFTKEGCDPTNRWTGTISYQRVYNHEDHSERKAGSGEGTITNSATSTLSQNVTVNIPWAGKPKASITMNGSTRTEEVGNVQIDCARVRIAKQKPEWKSAGWNHVTRTEQTASGGGEASVSVTIGHDKYEIAVGLPEIESTTTYTVTKHNDGGCGKPTDDSPAPVKVPEKMTLRLPPIDMPLQKPDVLQGSNKDELGGTITWNLKRTTEKK
jgi:hypothetical protein